MDSRDMLIIGAVAVAAFLFYRSRQGGVSVASTTPPLIPTAVPVDQMRTPVVGVPRWTGTSTMTHSAASTTTASVRPPMVNQLGAGLASNMFGGFSAFNMEPSRFAGSTATAVISDAIPPAPVTRAPVVSTPTMVGGAGVYPAGASSMGSQPSLTSIFNPLMKQRY